MKPCILTDKQEQLRLAAGANELGSSLNLISRTLCGCGCGAVVEVNVASSIYCGSLKCWLMGVTLWRVTSTVIDSWFYTRQYIENGIQTQRLIISDGKQECPEVVLISRMQNSPFCSVLTAAGMINSVLDLDWFNHAQITGGDQKK
jgi:hypothetical protein